MGIVGLKTPARKESADELRQLVLDTVAAVRKVKSERKVSIKTQIGVVEVIAHDLSPSRARSYVTRVKGDLLATLNARDIKVVTKPFVGGVRVHSVTVSAPIED
jgi:hypothetical protein